MNNIDANVTAWQLGPVTIQRGTATPGRDVTHPEASAGSPSSPSPTAARSASACAASPKCAPSTPHANSSTGRRHGA